MKEARARPPPAARAGAPGAGARADAPRGGGSAPPRRARRGRERRQPAATARLLRPDVETATAFLDQLHRGFGDDEAHDTIEPDENGPHEAATCRSSSIMPSLRS